MSAPERDTQGTIVLAVLLLLVCSVFYIRLSDERDLRKMAEWERDVAQVEQLRAQTVPSDEAMELRHLKVRAHYAGFTLEDFVSFSERCEAVTFGPGRQVGGSGCAPEGQTKYGNQPYNTKLPEPPDLESQRVHGVIYDDIIEATE